jgi:hypothetical protein
MYAVDTVPRSWQSTSWEAHPYPPLQFDVRLNRGTSPHLLVAYDFRHPFGQLDTTTAWGAELVARTAAAREEYARRAERLAHIILGQGPLPLTVAPAETFRSKSLEEFMARCEVQASGTQ